jgi:CRISPR-associated protein Cas5t
VLTLKYTAPICAFRPYEAREFQESLPAPPPSTLFGMLLSLCGLEPADRERFAGIELASAVLSPVLDRSVVLRRMRRGGIGPLKRNPEFQELLTQFAGIVALRPGGGGEGGEFIEQIGQALAQPAGLTRYGALSIGESAFLIDEIGIHADETELEWLVRDPHGFLDLTVWIDFADPVRTRKVRYSMNTSREIPDAAWTRIGIV